ncbi:MAG: vitamin B12 dependent methionine synthase [Clostridiales bacterium]|jgi:hypothetical protein|nr:vitamin B12 dependent methionine synthase [Clostridiales bacterium]
MSVIVLDNIAWNIDVNELMKRFYIPHGSEDAARLEALARAAEKVGKPKAMFKVSHIEDRGDDFVIVDGIKLKSRILRINFDESDRVFPYVVTCGSEIEEWSKTVDDFMERYWVDGMKEMALAEATKALYYRVEHEFLKRSVTSMNPGSLKDWPIEQQKQLFQILGDPKETIGVQLTDSYLMLPMKSASGILFSTSKGFENCRMCPRENCPGRRAPYDPQLVESYKE